MKAKVCCPVPLCGRPVCGSLKVAKGYPGTRTTTGGIVSLPTRPSLAGRSLSLIVRTIGATSRGVTWLLFSFFVCFRVLFAMSALTSGILFSESLLSSAFVAIWALPVPDSGVTSYTLTVTTCDSSGLSTSV